MKHKKPTSEELEDTIKKTTEEIEKLDAPEPSKPAPSEPVPSEPAPSEPAEPEKEPENEPEPSEPAPSEAVDYKKKFVNSTRESQVLHAKNKKINEVVEKATTMPDPTEDELVAEFPDWDAMSDTEKKLAKKTYKYDKAFAMLNEVTKESKDIEAWNGKIDAFVDDPKTLVNHPSLEGRVEEFKLFASKPTRRGVDFADLVSAFSYEADKAKPKNKGKMFEAGTGGPNEKTKPKSKLTAMEGRTLMKTDYKKYVELLKAGKIDNE